MAQAPLMTPAPITLAISGLDPSEYPAASERFSVSEIDFFKYTLWSNPERKALKKAVRSGHQVIWSASERALFLGQDDATVGHERWQLLLELAHETASLGILIRGPASTQLPFPAQIPCFLDIPQGHRSERTLSLPPVWDPLWDPKPPTQKQLKKSPIALSKIHGWHPSRWIRRYGSIQITQAKNDLQKWHAKTERPIYVILGHSQRREQIEEFRCDSIGRPEQNQ